MDDSDKKTVKVGSRLAKFIGSKATRDKKLQAASMQAEFTLKDTLVMLCYLSRDSDQEISTQARKNLIPAARSWHSRPDKPELPGPIHEIVMKVIEKVGTGEEEAAAEEEETVVRGNIGLLGLGEIIQAIDHNNRTVTITLKRNGDTARVLTEKGKVVGAVCGDDDGMEALYKAFSFADAEFTYVHEEPTGFNNHLKVNTLTLVMDALDYFPDQDPFETDVSKKWSVVGHLRTMNIFEIAEIFEMNSKQCACLLKREDEQGTLFFNSGRVVNAKLGEMEGLDAACHLLAWPNANFIVKKGGHGVPEEIHVGMQNLIIEAMRLVDEGVTVSDRIASELEKINELFEGADVVTLPVLDRVRLVFGDNEQLREALEGDFNPLVRKAIKVKISKTVHKYLAVTTDHPTKLKAAEGRVPLSTTEKLVLLSYLSHDESEEIRETAKQTLTSLDSSTYRKGLGSDMHPAVLDFLVREAVKDHAIIKMVCGREMLMEETAEYILERWQDPEILETLADNKIFLDRSPAISRKIWDQAEGNDELRAKIEAHEQSLLEGMGDIKIEGPLAFCGIAGLARAAQQGARSSTIVLYGASGTGYLYVARGKFIGAKWGTLEGKNALEEMFKHRDLMFRLVLRTFFHVENLDVGVTDSIMENPEGGPFIGEDGPSPVASVSGSPEAMDIFEALSLFENTPAPIRVNYMCEEGSGSVYRDRRHVLHVHVDGKESAYEAMAGLLAWDPKKILIKYALEEFPVTVDKTLGDFITETFKQIPEELKRAAKPGELPQWELSEEEAQSLYNQILKMGVSEKIKLALVGNKEARDILVRDPNKLVSVAVVKSPKIQENEIEAIAKSRAVGVDVLREISSTKQWMKSYGVKLNLVSNSKVPLPIALKLLPQIREYDLKKIAKSKEVSSQVAKMASKFAQTKGGKE